MWLVVLILSLIVIARIVFLWAVPFGPCPHCSGRGVTGNGRRRLRVCPRCKGVGRRQRPGSKTVHQLARRVERERARQRKLRTRTEDPS